MTVVVGNGFGSNESGAIDWLGKRLEADMEQSVETLLRWYARHVMVKRKEMSHNKKMEVKQ
jgi:hypothetical protein